MTAKNTSLYDTHSLCRLCMHRWDRHIHLCPNCGRKVSHAPRNCRKRRELLARRKDSVVYTIG